MKTRVLFWDITQILDRVPRAPATLLANHSGCAVPRVIYSVEARKQSYRTEPTNQLEATR
jgi:hypothetical protein